MASFRELPKVDKLAEMLPKDRFGEHIRIEAARRAISRARAQIAAGSDLIEIEAVAMEIANEMSRLSLRPLINASGVILHTGGGRARLAKVAADHVAAVANDHASVEVDLETGKRGDRQTHVGDLITQVTGAESALVVNNCAAAVFLVLSALCSNREVVLSRGQMVEIGGSFRLPDIVRQSGCRLVEVGCTNKTHLDDFAQAIGEQTAAILRCHPSNFKIVGFTDEPTIGELAALCRKNDLILVDDVGSGCLLDTTAFGLPKEPTVMDSVVAGADIVMCSGDKLMGGPQAGLILGRRDLIDAVKRHPLARAVRIDKLTLAALESTLRLYATGQEQQIPTVKYLSRDPEECRGYAEQIAAAFPGGGIVERGVTEVGGGSLPGACLPTYRVGLAAADCEALSRDLRLGDPPILTRIENGRVWLDPRTMEVEEVDQTCIRLRTM